MAPVTRLNTTTVPTTMPVESTKYFSLLSYTSTGAAIEDDKITIASSTAPPPYSLGVPNRSSSNTQSFTLMSNGDCDSSNEPYRSSASASASNNNNNRRTPTLAQIELDTFNVIFNEDALKAARASENQDHFQEVNLNGNRPRPIDLENQSALLQGRAGATSGKQRGSCKAWWDEKAIVVSWAILFSLIVSVVLVVVGISMRDAILKKQN